MPRTSHDNQSHARRAAAARASAWAAALALLLFAGVAVIHDDAATGAGTLVVIEDVSSMGGGSFSGNVCYQVVRDSDGVTISEGCFSVAATIAGPEGMEIGIPYTIYISMADVNCVLYDGVRNGDGSSPFVVQVSCDAAFMTATANAQPPATETPAPLPTETPTPVPTLEPTTPPTSIPSPTIEPTSPAVTEPPVETEAPEQRVDEEPTPTFEAEESSAGQIEFVASDLTAAPIAVAISSLTLDEASTGGTVVVHYQIANPSGAHTTVSLSAASGDGLKATGVEPTDGQNDHQCPAVEPMAFPVDLTAPLPLAACAPAANSATGSGFQQGVSLGLPTTNAAQTAILVITLAIGPGS